MKPHTMARATVMLEALLEQHQTYRQVGESFRLAHSTVERQTKALLQHVERVHGLEGIDDLALVNLQFLRTRSQSVMASVRAMAETDARPVAPMGLPTADELAGRAARVRRLSENRDRDVALLYVLFATGARVIEIARLKVSDYLDHDGRVRTTSELPVDAAFRGRTRPLYFQSVRLCEALDRYLSHRLAKAQGVSGGSTFRGLEPASRLFLTERGRPFDIVHVGHPGGSPRCPVMQALYQSIFLRAGWPGLTAMQVRQRVARQMVGGGASPKTIKAFLGLKQTRSVRQMINGPTPSIESLVAELA